jgi:signal transduction histidine kinase
MKPEPIPVDRESEVQILATMTHELRTPINIVMGNLDIFLGGFLGELNNRQKESLKTAMRNSGEALNLIQTSLQVLHETALRGASLKAMGTGTCRFRQALTVGVSTLRGRGGGPQGTGLLTTAARLAPLKCQLT